jgi:uncharacterized membrane protein
MDWLYVALVSVVAVSFAEIAQKLSISSKKDLSAETINFGIASVQLILCLVYLFVWGGEFSFALSPTEVLLVTLSGILSFFFFKFLYGSYKGNSASISQVIYSFSVFVSTVLGIIFFNESLTWLKVLGISLIVLAVSLVSIKPGERISKYNLLALFSALIYGLLTNIDKALSVSINIHWYQVLSVGSFLIFSLLFAGRKISSEFPQIDKPLLKTILISTVGFTIFNKLTFLAYSLGGEVGKVDAVNNTSLLLIIALEILILKDKSDLRKKIIGGILAVAGVVLLGYFP